MTKDKKGKNKLETLRGYARHRGINLSAVQKAIDKGHIKLRKDGKINVAQADLDWAANVRESPQSIRESKIFQKAKDKREHFEAELKEIQFKKEIGELVEIKDVEDSLFFIMKAVRDKFLSVPSKMAPLLAAEEDELKISEELMNEIEGILTELSEGFEEFAGMCDNSPKNSSSDITS